MCESTKRNGIRVDPNNIKSIFIFFYFCIFGYLKTRNYDNMIMIINTAFAVSESKNRTLKSFWFKSNQRSKRARVFTKLLHFLIFVCRRHQKNDVTKLTMISLELIHGKEF